MTRMRQMTADLIFILVIRHAELVSASHSEPVLVFHRGQMLKQVQHDIWRHLLFILSFWGSLFNTDVEKVHRITEKIVLWRAAEGTTARNSSSKLGISLT